MVLLQVFGTLEFKYYKTTPPYLVKTFPKTPSPYCVVDIDYER